MLLRDRAWVLLKHMNPKMELSVSTPPVIIMSARPSTSSAMATRTADSDAAHTASTVEFMPPRPRRFATRPATTLASSPGKVVSSHRVNAWAYFSAICSASSVVSPQLRTTSLSTGVDSRAASGCTSGTDPVVPRTQPVVDASYHAEPTAPLSRRRSRATPRLSSCIVLVISSWLGGSPHSSGLKSTSGTKPPRCE
ncbi:hypothetical protein SAMN05216215_10723 [Saccharopolyspora shandongensis]|uniref:Uncharacterized protein n=1 Tax=Saccharopolyspora shandongensis TaxID=418495 RepID=A0A1H3SY60_9PSEU|nr:hypothetical protein SAMN05216215_10723 [Saccharopolyspora shandongensis]